MKLFLSSIAISAEQLQAFLSLVGKRTPQELKLVLIENAADTYSEDKKGWMYDNRAQLMANGFQIDHVDLKQYVAEPKDLKQRLNANDVLWLGGGNSYYLRWILRETKADTLIKELVAGGKVYGGGSAGAMVAGPTLHYFEPAEHPDLAPELIYDGLGLTDTVVVPHWADPTKYGPIMQGVEEKLLRDGYKVVHLTNSQALIINGDEQSVTP